MKIKPFTEKKEKTPSGEQQKRIPLPGLTEAKDVMCRWTALQSYNTFNECKIINIYIYV